MFMGKYMYLHVSSKCMDILFNYSKYIKTKSRNLFSKNAKNRLQEVMRPLV